MAWTLCTELEKQLNERLTVHEETLGQLSEIKSQFDVAHRKYEQLEEQYQHQLEEYHRKLERIAGDNKGLQALVAKHEATSRELRDELKRKEQRIIELQQASATVPLDGGAAAAAAAAATASSAALDEDDLFSSPSASAALGNLKSPYVNAPGRQTTNLLVEIEDKYRQRTRELRKAKEENERLNVYLKQIMHAVQHKVPVIVEQKRQYETSVQEKADLTRCLEQALREVCFPRATAAAMAR